MPPVVANGNRRERMQSAQVPEARGEAKVHVAGAFVQAALNGKAPAPQRAATGARSRSVHAILLQPGGSKCGLGALVKGGGALGRFFGADEYGGSLVPVTGGVLEIEFPPLRGAGEMPVIGLEREFKPFRGADEMPFIGLEKEPGGGADTPAAIAPVASIVANAQAPANTERFVVVCRDMSFSC